MTLHLQHLDVDQARVQIFRQRVDFCGRKLFVKQINATDNALKHLKQFIYFSVSGFNLSKRRRIHHTE